MSGAEQVLMTTDDAIDEYDGLNFAVNTALLQALDSLDVAFERYEALEDVPHALIEINGCGAETLDDLSAALHRDHRTGLGYRFEQPGLRAASELAQTAADALREYGAGTEDSEVYLAELCRELLAFELTPEVAAELASTVRACLGWRASGGCIDKDNSAASAAHGPPAA